MATPQPGTRDPGTSMPTEHPGAHIADPAPLGLAGFACTTLALSWVNAGLTASAVETSTVVALAFFYGGLAQLLAAMWEFKKGNTFGAAAFGTFGPFWLAFAFYVHVLLPTVPKADQASTTGWFLLVFTIVTLYLTLASLRTTGILALVFVALLVTFIFLDIAEFGGAASAGKIGGYIGIITAILAFYASAAAVVNATWKKTVLPVFPLAPEA
ncbi:MAG: acetate uptake transporter [Sciscionella sp.]